MVLLGTSMGFRGEKLYLVMKVLHRDILHDEAHSS